MAPPPDFIERCVEQSTEAVRSDRFGGYLDRWYQQWRPEFVAWVGNFGEVDLSSLDDQEVAGQLAEVLDLTTRAFEIHMLLHGVNAVTLSELAFTCRDLLGWNDSQALELLSGLSEATTAPATALAGMAAMARERPAVRALLEGEDEGDAASRLAEVDPEFAAAFTDYQREFGLRAIRYETIDPSVGELPTLTLHLIADQLRSGYDAAGRAAEVACRREAARAAARALLADRPAADRARFDRALTRAERWYPVREDNAPMTVSEPIALIRRTALELGRRFACASVIDDAGDIFFLELEEVFATLALGASGAFPDHRDLVRRRQAERAWVEAHPGPPVYGQDPGRPPLDDLPTEARFMNEAFMWLLERSGHFGSVPPQDLTPVLTGVGASVGRYTGRARVLLTEDEFDKLQPGDVLVCRITSPAWSMLFPIVGALVTDAGGVLSHPAIIAREFRIPAVVATGNGTELLRDGQLVTVDGSAGSVEILS